MLLLWMGAAAVSAVVMFAAAAIAVAARAVALYANAARVVKYRKIKDEQRCNSYSNREPQQQQQQLHSHTLHQYIISTAPAHVNHCPLTH